MANYITHEQLGRLEAALNSRITQLQSFRSMLRQVDTEVLEVGLELFEHEDLLLDWLTEPAVSLGGEIPLRLMGAAEGSQLVARTLRRILHGIY